MASILEVKNGTTTLLPTESWAAPNGLFGATADRNDGSIYGWADSTSTITLPSSGLADGYLFLWGYELEDTSNGRVTPQGKMVQASGTGNFESSFTAGYCRDNSEDRAYVAGWSFVDGPSASATFQFQWKRDFDSPTGGTVRSYIQAVPFYYSDIGLYSSTTAALYGGTTPNLMTGFSGTDGTNITISSNQVSVTGDNKRYLVLGAGFMEGHGASRTQRWYGLEIDGTFDHAAKGCMYLRNASNDEGGESFIRMIETDTATRTIEMNCYRGDGVAAGQGGADVDGSTPTVAAHALVVIELNDSAEVYSSLDSVGGQEFAVTGPVDVDIASTSDIEFNDAASFTRSTDTGVNIETDMDVFAFANVSHAREASSIGSGTRWTVHGEFTIDGVEVTDVGFHGNYNRGNQSSADCHGSSCNQAGVFAVTTGEDIGVSNQELAGTEGGAGDIESQAGWVGFGLINLDTLEDSGSDVIEEPGAGSCSLTGLAPTVTETWPSYTAEPGAASCSLAGAAPSISIDTGSATIEVPKTELHVVTRVGLHANGQAPTIDVTTGGGDVTAEPTAGSLDTSGLAPTAATTENHIIGVPVGSLSVTGLAATVEIDHIRLVPIGVIDFASYVPTVSATANQTRAPPQGTLALTGLAPSAEEDHIRETSAGSLSLTGYAPSTSDSINIDVPAGSLSLTGLTPTAEEVHTAEMPAGSGSFTGIAPSVTVGLTIEVPHTELRMKTDVGLFLNGYPPTPVVQASGDKTVEPGVGSLTLTGLAPTSSESDNKFALTGAGSLTLSGQLESIHTDYGMGAGSLAIAGIAPELAYSWVIDVPVGSAGLTGNAPSLSTGGDSTVEPNVGSLTIGGLAPGVLNNFSIEVGLGRPEFTTYAPTLLTDSPVIAVPKGELHLVTDTGLKLYGQAPTVLVETPGPIEVFDGSLTLTGLAPLANETHTRLPAQGELSFATYAPSPGIGSPGGNTVFPGGGSPSFTGNSPAIEIVINNADSSLLLAGKSPNVSTTSNPSQNETAAPGVGSLTLTGLDPERPHGLLLMGYAPSVTGANQTIDFGESGTEGYFLTGHAPTTFAENPIIEIPGTGSLSLTTYAPTLEGLVAPPTGSLSLTGLQIQPLAYSWVVRPETGGMTCTGYVPGEASKKKGGRRRRRYLVEIDNQFFEVNTPQEAEALLQQAAELVEEQPEITRPVIRVKTGSGKPSQSKVVQRAVKRTESRINRAIERAQLERDKRAAIDREISVLLALKLKEEQDDEEALLAILLS